MKKVFKWLFSAIDNQKVNWWFNLLVLVGILLMILGAVL